MRICVLGTRGFPFVQGGVERHCESLYPLFSDEFQFVIFRRKPYIKQEASSISYPNIRFIDLPSTRIKGVETLFHSFLATVLSIWQKPDIVHIHNIGPALFSPLLRLCGIKVVLTYHSPNYEHDKWNKVGKSVLRLSEKIALKMANAILFVNKFQMGKYPDRIREIASPTSAPIRAGSTHPSPRLDRGIVFKNRWNRRVKWFMGCSGVNCARERRSCTV